MQIRRRHLPYTIGYTQRGLVVLELVVAVALLITVAAGVFAAARFVLVAQRFQIEHRKALLIAQEGLAVARFERDGNWATFAGRPLDTALYPTFTQGSALLSQTNPGPIDGVFTSTVTLSSVYRDGNGNIASSGTLDSDARFVAAEVSWTDAFGVARQAEVDSYLMNL